jgi:DNA modification methylase
MTITLRQGCCQDVLPTLEAESVQCVVTSPPYYGLRDYGVAGQIGLEPSPQAYVDKLVAVFREVRRVLRKDGTCWLNLGDSYAGSWGAQGRSGQMADRSVISARQIAAHQHKQGRTGSIPEGSGLKPKDLVMIPARTALALQADGWWVRSKVIWNKPNPTPESCTDRPTSAYEEVFLLTRSERYFYDADAVRQPFADERMGCDGGTAPSERNRGGRRDGFTKPSGINPSANGGANLRNVWTIATSPFPGAHFATMPPELARRCILAGSRPGDTVLDPFAGSGTTGLVADRAGRHAVLIDLSPDYSAMSRARIEGDAPLFAEFAA